MLFCVVAPRVGAWIETNRDLFAYHHVLSHPVWVRGLKQNVSYLVRHRHRSHPVWVRGLKHVTEPKLEVGKASHPVWVRGLKLILRISSRSGRGVAPRVGAWIETPSSNDDLHLSESHPVWVRGLKRTLS